jgi:hypothetical protein
MSVVKGVGSNGSEARRFGISGRMLPTSCDGCCGCCVGTLDVDEECCKCVMGIEDGLEPVEARFKEVCGYDEEDDWLL